MVRLLKEVVDACREEGVNNPNLFFEPESAAIFVMNGNHEHDRHSDKATMADRQKAIVARIPVIGIECPFGAGAW